MKKILAAVLNPYRRSVEQEETSSRGECGGVELDVSVIESYAHYLSGEGGCSGVFVCGSTGDFSLLSLEERLQIQGAWLKPQVRNLFQHVIIHIGSPVFSHMIQLGKHASQNGATALCVTFPAFPGHAPKTEQQLVEYMTKLCSLFPQTAMMLYNIAGSTHPNFHNNFFPLAQELENINNFVGMKYTSPVYADAFEILNNTSLDVALGCDEKVLDAYEIGFKAFIGATFSFVGRHILDILRKHDDGKKDEAEKLFVNIKHIASRLQSEGIFFYNVRLLTNKYMNIIGVGSLGNDSRFYFLTEEDKIKAEQMADEIINEFREFLLL